MEQKKWQAHLVVPSSRVLVSLASASHKLELPKVVFLALRELRVDCEDKEEGKDLRQQSKVQPFRGWLKCESGLTQANSVAPLSFSPRESSVSIPSGSSVLTPTSRIPSVSPTSLIIRSRRSSMPPDVLSIRLIVPAIFNRAPTLSLIRPSVPVIEMIEMVEISPSSAQRCKITTSC